MYKIRVQPTHLYKVDEAMKGSDPNLLVQLEAAGRYVDGRWLVRGVDLTVSRSEIVTLIGPNGSGKSTTAKLILGLNRPTDGMAWQRPGLRVGYVPQTLALDWTMPLRVETFMSLTSRLSNSDMTSALEMVGASHTRKSEVRHLSGGEFQRVLMARAIARKPDLLVLDEPVQGVDFAGELALYDLIADIRAHLGCGIVLISHDLHMVMRATDRVVCLNGHVCCQGPPVDVMNSPDYQSLFGQRALESLALYQHDHDHTHLPDGRVRHADGSITNSCHPADGHHPSSTHQQADHV